MTYKHQNSVYIERYGCSKATLKRWKRMGAPLDDSPAMDLFRMRLRSRTGVSKNNRRTTTATAPKITTEPDTAEDDDRNDDARFYESEIQAIVNAFLALRETYPDAAAALTKVARDSAGWLLTID